MCSCHPVGIVLCFRRATLIVELAFDGLIVCGHVVLLIVGKKELIALADNLLVLSKSLQKKKDFVWKICTCSTVLSSRGPWAK